MCGLVCPAFQKPWSFNSRLNSQKAGEAKSLLVTTFKSSFGANLVAKACDPSYLES